jgi:hypothetical protein
MVLHLVAVGLRNWVSRIYDLILNLVKKHGEQPIQGTRVFERT